MDTNKYEYIADVLSKLPSSVYWKDKNGVYLGANICAVREAGLTSVEEIIGKTDYDLFTKKQADQFRRNDLQVMTTGKELSLEETSYLTNGDGKRLIKLSTKKPLLNKNGDIVGVVGMTVDITARKQAEEELKIAKEVAEQANLAKTQFIQNMGHDLRTPASGVARMTKLLERTEPDPQRKKELGMVSRSSEQLLNILNDVLAFDQVGSGKIPMIMKKFDIRTVVNNLVSMQFSAAESKQLKLTFDCAPNVPKIIVNDENRIFRILLNLIGNAIKFTPKGFVKISLSVAEKIGTRKNILKFVVADSGIGIPKDKQNAIYERFNRGTASNRGIYAGMGLGLAIVKQFVEELHGEIDVDSEVNQGTTFTCLLPTQLPLLRELREYEEEEKKNTENLAPLSTKQDMKILLVEDHQLAQTIAVATLKTSYPTAQVDVVDTGTLAIEKATKNNYDLIFMDLGLPDMRGTEVTKTIRKLKTNIPIIGLTANADSASQNDCINAGMNEALVKPLTEEKVATVVHKWVYKQDGVLPCVEQVKQAPHAVKMQIKNAINWEEVIKTLGKESINVLGNFVKELATDQQAIETAVAANDFNKIAFIAHKVKGGALYASAENLRATALALETAAKEKHKDDLRTLFDKFKAAINEVAEEVAQHGQP